MEKLTIDNKRGYTLAAYFEPDEDFKEQCSSMLKLVYVSEGSGIIKLNGQMVIFSAPAFFCFNELDEVVLQQNINLVASSIYFDPVIIDDSLQLSIIRKNYTQLSMTQYRDFFLIIPFIDREELKMPCIELGPMTSKRAARLFKGVEEELVFTENEFWPCRSRSFLLEILFLIQNLITDAKGRSALELPEATEDVGDIILYLHTNYNRKITIEELTEVFHINRTTLSEKFRSSIGTSIIEYLVKLRIKVASMMLRDTLLPISEILDRVGFNDSVHFIRMFKKHMGCTPSEYREKFMC
jgi:AraC-like DNA-binding protein